MLKYFFYKFTYLSVVISRSSEGEDMHKIFSFGKSNVCNDVEGDSGTFVHP